MDLVEIVADSVRLSDHQSRGRKRAEDRHDDYLSGDPAGHGRAADHLRAEFLQ